MPVYEYACPSCGANFEKQQSITANPIKTCPECGGRKVQRLISNTSFVLKGSGWYVTDYARKGKSPESSSKESGSKEGGSKESSSKSEGSTKSSDSADSKTGTSKKEGSGDCKPSTKASSSSNTTASA